MGWGTRGPPSTSRGFAPQFRSSLTVKLGLADPHDDDGHGELGSLRRPGGGGTKGTKFSVLSPTTLSWDTPSPSWPGHSDIPGVPNQLVHPNSSLHPEHTAGCCTPNGSEHPNPSWSLHPSLGHLICLADYCTLVSWGTPHPLLVPAPIVGTLDGSEYPGPGPCTLSRGTPSSIWPGHPDILGVPSWLLHPDNSQHPDYPLVLAP